MKMAGPHILLCLISGGRVWGEGLPPPQTILYTSIGIFLLYLYFYMLFCGTHEDGGTYSITLYP